MPLLSKSKYMKGLECPRLLWYAFNNPDAIPDHDEGTKAAFRRGQRIGELARQLYPEGRLVEYGEFMETVRETKKLVDREQTVFEASFKVDDLYCRVDILHYDDGWHIVEVKSSTKVKDRYIEDVAFQLYCLRGAGLDVASCSVLHVNKEYVRHGSVEPESLFEQREVTDRIIEKQEEVAENVDWMRNVIRLDEPPSVSANTHRGNSYDCQLGDLCHTWPEHSVKDLHYIGDDAYTLAEEGVEAIENVPESFDLTEKQRVQIDAVSSGEPVVDVAAIHSFLQELEEPLYFIDFEACMPAIPLFDGASPYEHIPFQYSLHRLEDGTVKHDGYLYDGDEDPRPALGEALHGLDPDTLIAYNTSFEQRMLDSISAVSEFDLTSWKDRFVDLEVPFRKFWYYHPEQHGSYSLKAVLPCLVGDSYDELEVDDGAQAARDFVRVNYRDGEDEQVVRESLREYCKKDTEALIHILRALERLVNERS